MFYQSIVETFHRMGYSIVSEGVETEEEMSLLSSWGVDMIQGYYFPDHFQWMSCLNC